VRLLAFSDFSYRFDGDAVYAEMPFALFMCGLLPHVERLTLIGREHPDPRDERIPHRVPPGVAVLGLPHYGSAASPATVLRALPATLRRLWRALDEADGVIAFGPSPVACALALLALARRRRLAIGVRQDYPRYVANRHPGRRGLRAAALAMEAVWRALARVAATVTVGPDLAERYRHGRHVHATTVSLVDDADVATAIRERAAVDGPIRVLSVGRLDAEKNPLLLADVLAQLSADGGGWRLTVCGEGPLRDALRERLERLGVADRAVLAGYVPVGPELARRYGESDVLLHVSLTEGVPQVLFEAFATGLPVVATAVGGVPAVAAGAAVLIPAEDAAAAADALRLVVADEGLRTTLANEGLMLARSNTRQAQCRRLAGFLARAWGDPSIRAEPRT
jgi:glycosyltransferase involved in cell wall biosynthesis